jgi:hypothetical protein
VALLSTAATMNKKYFKSKPYCKVTFSPPKELTEGAQRVWLLGDFNQWDPEKATELKKLSSGQFKSVLDLEKGKSFAFKYWVDKTHWINDPQEEGWVDDNFGGKNSLVSTEE